MFRSRPRIAALITLALLGSAITADAVNASGAAQPVDDEAAPLEQDRSSMGARRIEAGDSTPWVLPSMPDVCTDEQKDSGNVGSCLFDGRGAPDDRGWDSPPFPTTAPGPQIPWVDLGPGASGHVVVDVQQALIARDYDLTADGQFGPMTTAAVRDLQDDLDLPVTGVVDQATANALGVVNTQPGSFPPAGWTWLGWAYNGSAALSGWESALASNDSKIGKVRVGQLRSMTDALPLFEGFVRDIVAGGYSITDIGTYSFRCTSNSLKSCAGLTRAKLSNHSWGMALDMNTGANPELTYTGVNGASACATPMKSDIPMWVVRAAERWGLYWGGYGWGGGCESPSEMKSSVLRDTMHFEFRGTPEEARAILMHNLGGACMDAANDDGEIVKRCLTPGDVPDGGIRLVVDTDAPEGATAALVNITATDTLAAGYLTAESCGPAPSGVRTSSNGNTAPDKVVANLSVVPIDEDGRFCLYRSTPTHTVVDVQGFFGDTEEINENGTTFHSIAPQRVMDTRAQSFCGPGGGCVELGPVPAGSAVAVASKIAPPEAVAMLANLTVTEPQASGYLTADACSTLVPGPQTRSNANFRAGDTVANLAVVPVDDTEIGPEFCTYSSAPTQKVVDLQGYFAPDGFELGMGFTPQKAQRLIDTRECWTDHTTEVERCALLNQPGEIIHLQAPEGASSVLVNIALTDATMAGYVTADRCSALKPGPQTKSNGNIVPDAVAANLAVVPVDEDGSFCLTASAPMHVVVDIQGTFSLEGELKFLPITPVRQHDSRGMPS